MSKVSSLFAVLLVIFFATPQTHAAPPPGHALPQGKFKDVREREVDVEHLTTDLRVNLADRTVSGSATITFAPLRENLHQVSLDAAKMQVGSVSLLRGKKSAALDHSWQDRKLHIRFPHSLQPGEQIVVKIEYSVKPQSGLYFFPETTQRSAEAWNYGEGGRHYGWLPMYNDTNDRFTLDMKLTVDKPFIALSNGVLTQIRDNPDGSRSYHWVQDKPIPNYLMALKVGEFVEIPLDDAKLGERKIPLSAWAHRGEEDRAAYAFGRTPKMVEFFSELFGYDYPWDKYDQVVLRNFAGAMETTSMVGFQESHLKTPDDPVDDTPYYDAPAPIWSYEDTISHELAHHWFGDLVTCRSVSSIFLNESFASYSHTVWNGHINGEDDLTYQRWIYLDKYLGFVADTGTVRPLEYNRWDASGDMFTQPITYIKGALVLHMLRQLMGDESFYRGISHYLHSNAFSEVDSHDFQRAMEESSGMNLTTFFEDWIRGGGGFPDIRVNSQWSEQRKQLDLSLEQVQANLEFENDFQIPVKVEVVTASGSEIHTVNLKGWSTIVSIPADSEPLMVNVDKGNWLVASIHHPRSLDETVRALAQADLAVALRAARQLGEDFGSAPAAVVALASVLGNNQAHWGLRQEAALNLGSLGTRGAVTALTRGMADSDPRIRRAAALGLGRAGGEQAILTLKDSLTIDPDEEVAGAAAWSLGKLQIPGVERLLKEQLERPSAYYDYRRLSALAGLAELENPALAPIFARYTDPAYLRETRLAAAEAWVRAAPNDPQLAKRLRELTRDDDADVRGAALELLGSLHRAEDRSYLLTYAEEEIDPNIAKTARLAAEEIASFNP